MTALTNPNQSPAEALEISPEGLEIANCYLQTQDAQQVASLLDIPVELVTRTLARREIRTYVDAVFFDVGFNNRFRMRSAMDALIKQKFNELEEAQIGSSKDIVDLLALSHKMSMEYMDKQIQLEKLKQANTEIKTQTNIQFNNGAGDGTKYGELIAQLLNPQQSL